MTRRLASLATLLFFAQLSLVGGVARCWLASTGAHTTHAAAPSSHQGHGDTDSHDTGKGDALPGCTATSMCVVVMIPPAVGDAVSYPVPEHARIAAAPTAPLSITQAPELPPPRG